jgi:GNAT superfamily N-acetyltransferase
VRARGVASGVLASSLAARTESWFVDEVVPAGPGATALRCPSDPSFRWGNLLVLDAPPAPGERAALERRFAAAFADLPAVTHATFAWTGEDGALEAFVAAGYEPDRTTVRAAGPDDPTSAPRTPSGFALRPVVTAADWDAVHALHLADPPEGEDPEGYRRHREARLAVYQAVQRGDRPGLDGSYYLVTLDGAPAGSMGVYVRGELGRFQYVHVAAPFRRRGVATAMVHAVAREGFDRYGAGTLVIMGDEGQAADGIYARLGFRPVERYVGACAKDRAAVRTPDP